MSEEMIAYKAGLSDACDGKPRCNASDIYGPYNGDYEAGYNAGLRLKRDHNEDNIRKTKK